MKTLNILLGISLIFLFSCSHSDKPDVSPEKPSKVWRAQLILSQEEGIKLPFLMEFDPLDSILELTVINGPERITLNSIERQGDSLFVQMDPYNSRLELVIEGKDIKGIWRNFAKGPDYTIPFIARNGSSIRFIDSRFSEYDLSGNYAVQFGDSTNGYVGLAELSQQKEKVLGTIRTETGDYRYLEGRQAGDQLFLSCFDGSHAFLFQANVDSNRNLYDGHFYSGSHYHKSWEANRNDTFQLTSPDSLTQLLPQEDAFEFELSRANGELLTLADPRFDNKVSIVQIMGTWCPNCKDESEYLKTVYEQYSPGKIEIVAACFEYERTPEKAFQRMKTYKNLLQLPYELCYGGPSKKDSVLLAFPSLDKVVSFPTMIVLDRNKQVVKIHAGFNGPATSQYEPFVQEMKLLLDSLTQNPVP